MFIEFDAFKDHFTLQLKGLSKTNSRIFDIVDLTSPIISKKNQVILTQYFPFKNILSLQNDLMNEILLLHVEYSQLFISQQNDVIQSH